MKEKEDPLAAFQALRGALKDKWRLMPSGVEKTALVKQWGRVNDIEELLEEGVPEGLVSIDGDVAVVANYEEFVAAWHAGFRP